MKKAGGEVGLFYYYFSGKDNVFDKALELYLQGIGKTLQKLQKALTVIRFVR